MKNVLLIAPEEAFQRICQKNSKILDVRSEGEFQEGNFKNTVNIPILNNEHRRQVGITYKEKGPEAARELGHFLVSGKYKASLITSWCDYINKDEKRPIVFCWRGGLRSQIAQEWLKEREIEIFKVKGGYKKIRKRAVEVIDTTSDFIVLSGMTGAGKTKLLHQLDHYIDLEELAMHRGSVFGKFFDQEQPSQATFENHLAQSLKQQPQGPYLVEDESRFVGKRTLRDTTYNSMSNSPMVFVDASSKERAKAICQEYVFETMEQGISELALQQEFERCLNKIRPKLGGLECDNILRSMNDAFLSKTQESHVIWIEALLLNYYDKMYKHALNKKSRKVLFSGLHLECLEFLKDYQKRVFGEK